MSSQTIPHANDAGVLSSPWDDALFDVPARAGLERMLPAFIAARRWYRTKTKHVHDARIVAAFPLKYGPLEAARAQQVICDGFAKSGDSTCRYVAVAAGGCGVAESIHDRSGGMKIWFAELQVNDGAALAFEFFSAGENSQCAFAG